MMDRRRLVGALALGTLALPRAVAAQGARRVYRIGILGSSGKTVDLQGPQPRGGQINGFLRGMRELGYVYGEHFVTEPRGAEGQPERYATLAEELVRLPVDVIVAAGPTLGVLKQATSTVPVVMAASGDPVGEGLVQSLSHPGSNFTGLSSQSADVTGKRLELLKELVPLDAPVGVVWDQTVVSQWMAAQAAAHRQGWTLTSLEIRDAGRFEETFRTARDARASALLVVASGALIGHAGRVAELAARSRLPAMYSQRVYVEAGGLMSYSADLDETWHRAAVFVDKILKGARPAELPVEQPTKFRLVINLKAAAALGLTIPQALLLRADEVIQ